jgi:hypothetical protein
MPSARRSGCPDVTGINPDESLLSGPDSKAGRLQRALLDRLAVHEREGTLPTSGRFLFYELVQAGVIGKAATGKRRADQDMTDALAALREAVVIPWDWITDETRKLTLWETAKSVADYVLAQVKYASLDPWASGDEPAPLILCESRSLSGALRDTAALYCCPIGSTNGQTRGFLVTKVARTLREGQRVLYLGDWDWCGRQIEQHSYRTLAAHNPVSVTWERLALTPEQIETYDLPVIQKPDRRYRPPRSFDAVETEALGQARIVAALTARLDELLPEPLADVHERERAQRREVRDRLRDLLGDTDE